MIPYGRQKIDKEDIEAVNQVLTSDFLTQGPKVKEFEESLKKASDTQYAVVVNSGTAALHLAYLAAGIGEGDEVIVPPNTFVATTNMLLEVGAVPIFCDISLETYNIDADKIEDLITEKTKAIVTVDFAGRACDYDEINLVAKKYDLLVIADGSHSLGAVYKNKKVGTCALVTTSSFHPVKTITTGEGGALLTDDEQIYKKSLSLRSHGIHKNDKGLNVMTDLGFNYRMPDILAALGAAQMEKLEIFLEARRQVATWYEKYLSKIESIFLPVPSNESGWHLYVIRVKDKKDRMPLSEFLLENGIGINFHYPAVYAHPYYRNNGYQDISLPNTEEYQNTCLTLPCHVHIEESDIKYISDLIFAYFNQSGE